MDATIDSWVARVGEVAGVESYLTLTGGFTGTGPIMLTCRAANGHPLEVDSAAMTAITVGTLN